MTKLNFNKVNEWLKEDFTEDYDNFKVVEINNYHVVLEATPEGDNAPKKYVGVLAEEGDYLIYYKIAPVSTWVSKLK